MATHDEVGAPGWADGFVHNSDGHRRRLHAWAVFHDMTHYSSVFSPVPPIPPMVLQMLNDASVQVQWTFSVDDATGKVEGVRPFGVHGIKLTLESLQRPNWWRSLEVNRAADVQALLELPLRLRHLRLLDNGVVLPPQAFQLKPLHALRHVVLHTAAVRVADVAALPRLASLTLGPLTKVADADVGIVARKATALQRFAAFSCALITSVRSFARSRTLVELVFRWTALLSEGLVGLERIPTLRRLELSSSKALTSVSCLAGSVSLVDLNLESSSVTSEGLEGLARIPTLTKLDLSDCEKVTSVSCLASSTSLRELMLLWSSVTSAGLVGLELIPTLTKIDLKYSKRATSVSCLAASRSLVKLDLSYSFVTSDGLVGLEYIPTLARLKLAYCRSVASVITLAGSVSLRVVILQGTALTSDGLVGLERMPSLTELDVSNCKAVSSVAFLDGSKSLVALNLQGTSVPPECQAGWPRPPRPSGGVGAVCNAERRDA